MNRKDALTVKGLTGKQKKDKGVESQSKKKERVKIFIRKLRLAKVVRRHHQRRS